MGLKNSKNDKKAVKQTKLIFMYLYDILPYKVYF